MDKQNVIITGVGGFIGSKLAESLVKSNYYKHIIGIDDLSGGYYENIPKGVKFHKLDLTRDFDRIEKLFEDYNPIHVFHLAAYAAEGLSHFIRNFNYRNNLIASSNLINLAIKYETWRFVFTSSMSVYGSQQVPFSEDMRPNPEDPYGIAKYATEMDLKCAHDLFGLDYTIFRPHNVYGPNQNIWDTYRNVVGIFIYQAIHDIPLTIFGDGTQVRAFSYIDDIVTPIVDCVHNSEFGPVSMNETFNIGGDVPYHIYELADTVTEVAKVIDHKTVKLEYLPPRYEVHTAFPTQDKIKRLHPTMKTSNKFLYDGIEEMYKWAKEQPERATSLWERGSLELTEKLPLKWERIMK